MAEFLTAVFLKNLNWFRKSTPFTEPEGPLRCSESDEASQNFTSSYRIYDYSEYYVIFPTTSTSSKCSVSFRFHIHIYAFLMLHAQLISCPLFEHLNNSWWVQIINIIMHTRHDIPLTYTQTLYSVLNANSLSFTGYAPWPVLLQRQWLFSACGRFLYTRPDVSNYPPGGMGTDNTTASAHSSGRSVSW
jgi:hypothetical protein